MKHLKYTFETSETLETYACSMRFKAKYLLATWMKWRLVDGALDAGAELDAVEWHGNASRRAAARL